EKRPDLPNAVNDVIATAMAKAKESRYPTCGELIRALRAAAHGEAVAVPPADSTGLHVAAATVFATAPGASEVGPVAPVAQAAHVRPGGPPGGREPVPGRAPAVPRERRTVAVTPGRLVAAGLVIAALIAAGVAAALLLNGNDTTSSSPPTAGSTPTSTSVPSE